MLPADPLPPAAEPEGYAGDSGRRAPPRYCAACGGALAEHLPAGELRVRLSCRACGRVHYQNPIPVASTVIEQDGATLLLRRTIMPRAGTWVFPGGFVELGESTEEAAVREAREEAGVEVRLGPLLGVYNRPGPGIVLIVYRAQIVAGTPRAGHESDAIRWFRPEAIPWPALAFDTTMAALQDWARLQQSARRCNEG